MTSTASFHGLRRGELSLPLGQTLISVLQKVAANFTLVQYWLPVKHVSISLLGQRCKVKRFGVQTELSSGVAWSQSSMMLPPQQPLLLLSEVPHCLLCAPTVRFLCFLASLSPHVGHQYGPQLDFCLHPLRRRMC